VKEALGPYLIEKQWIASSVAVSTFEKLLSEYGGMQEHANWMPVKERLAVFSAEDVGNRFYSLNS
jgi:hypothetical protein